MSYLTRVSAILFRIAEGDRRAGRIHRGVTVNEIRRLLGNHGSKTYITASLKALEQMGLIEPPSAYRLRLNAKGEYTLPSFAEVSIEGSLIDTTQRRGFAKLGKATQTKSRLWLVRK
jgi:hypothetical protein